MFCRSGGSTGSKTSVGGTWRDLERSGLRGGQAWSRTFLCANDAGCPTQGRRGVRTAYRKPLQKPLYLACVPSAAGRYRSPEATESGVPLLGDSTARIATVPPALKKREKKFGKWAGKILCHRRLQRQTRSIARTMFNTVHRGLVMNSQANTLNFPLRKTAARH